MPFWPFCPASRRPDALAGALRSAASTSDRAVAPPLPLVVGPAAFRPRTPCRSAGRSSWPAGCGGGPGNSVEQVNSSAWRGSTRTLELLVGQVSPGSSRLSASSASSTSTALALLSARCALSSSRLSSVSSSSVLRGRRSRSPWLRCPPDSVVRVRRLGCSSSSIVNVCGDVTQQGPGLCPRSGPGLCTIHHVVSAGGPPTAAREGLSVLSCHGLGRNGRPGGYYRGRSYTYKFFSLPGSTLSDQCKNPAGEKTTRGLI